MGHLIIKMEAIRRMMMEEVMAPLKKYNIGGAEFGKMFKTSIILRKEASTEGSKLKPDFL